MIKNCPNLFIIMIYHNSGSDSRIQFIFPPPPDSRKCQGAAGWGSREDPQGGSIDRPRTQARAPSMGRGSIPRPIETPPRSSRWILERVTQSAGRLIRSSPISQIDCTRKMCFLCINPHGDKNGHNLFSPLGVCEGSGEGVGVLRVDDSEYHSTTTDGRRHCSHSRTIVIVPDVWTMTVFGHRRSGGVVL